MQPETLIDSYLNWLKETITFEKFNEYYEITVPFYDRFGDSFQLYAKQLSDGNIFITDDGYTISNLISSGISLKNNSKKKSMLVDIIKKYGLVLKGEDITITTSLNEFPFRKNMMIQAMIEIDSMYELSNSNVKELFAENVAVFFEENNIVYTRDIQIIGRTGNIWSYDFFFQRNNHNPEDRYCKTISNLTKTSRDNAIFSWSDSAKQRKNKSSMIAIVNDNNSVNEKDLYAFGEYNIQVISYSDISKYIQLFN
jgi:hypothetical protein